MDPKSLQNLLISTNKETTTIVKTFNFVKAEKLEDLPGDVVPRLKFTGTCDLCGLQGSVKRKVLEDEVFGHFVKLGCPKFFKNLCVCSICEFSINRAEKIYKSHRNLEDELDAVVSVVSSALRMQQRGAGNENRTKFEIETIGGNVQPCSSENLSPGFDSATDGPQRYNNASDGLAETPTVKVEIEDSTYNGTESGIGILDDTQIRLVSLVEVSEVHVVKDEQEDHDDAELHVISKHARPSRSQEGPYKCEICKKPFSKAHQLKRHFKTHEDNKLIKVHECCFCEKRFPYAWNLKQHVEDHMDIANPGTCKICQKECPSFVKLKRHHVAAHGTKEQKNVQKLKGRKYRSPQSCKTCGRVLSSIVNLKLHEILFHGKEEEKNALKSKRRRLADNRKAKKDPLPCYFCKKPFLAERKLNDHLQTHTNERPYKCPRCDKWLSCTSGLSSHYIAHHGTSEEIAALRKKRKQSRLSQAKLKCYFCYIIVNGFSDLDKHVRLLHTQEVFLKKCGKCQKVLRSQRLLRHHQVTVCSPTDESQQKYREGYIKSMLKNRAHCYFCKREIKGGNFALENHMRAHTMERPFKCEKCQATFKRKLNYDYHAVRVCKTETNEKKLAIFERRFIIGKEQERNRPRKPCENCGLWFKCVTKHRKICSA